ncbi:MAG TPA: replicative DNA helicase [Nitrospiria bacterium]
MSTMDISVRKVPPQNLEAEESVLGSILLHNEALNKVLEIMTGDDFYKESHRKIFSAIVDLDEQNEPIDIITLTDFLRGKNELEEVGGAAFLTSLVNSVPTAANVKYYSKIVHERALLRNLINVATEIVTSGYETTGQVDELLDFAESRIFGISEKKVKPSFFPVKDIVKESFETIERLYDKKERITGIPTGFKDLDDITSGFQPGDLIVIAGRPSMGKTAFSLGIAQNTAIIHRHTVAIFSLEMAKEQLVLRMLCSESRVDSHKLRSGYLGKNDWPLLTAAAGTLTEAPIFIDDSPAISILEMRAKARRLKAEHGLSMIIVDYLQLMRGRGNSDKREQEISDISRSLKALAKELRVPVIALSQLSRAVETRGGERKPILADLRESGAIEQDADVVIFIYRKEVYDSSEANKGLAEIMISKQRNGPVGSVMLTFRDRYTRFEDFSDRDIL